MKKTHLVLNGTFYCQCPGMRLVTNELEKVTCRRCLAAHAKGVPEIDYSDHTRPNHGECFWNHTNKAPTRTERRIETLL